MKLTQFFWGLYRLSGKYVTEDLNIGKIKTVKEIFTVLAEKIFEGYRVTTQFLRTEVNLWPQIVHNISMNEKVPLLFCFGDF